MLTYFFAFSLAVSFGFAGASFLRWVYVLFTGEMLAYRHLTEPGLMQPIRALAVVASGPDIMMEWGLKMWRKRRIEALAIIAASLLWSFFSGIVILTRIFGFS